MKTFTPVFLIASILSLVAPKARNLFVFITTVFSSIMLFRFFGYVSANSLRGAVASVSAFIAVLAVIFIFVKQISKYPMSYISAALTLSLSAVYFAPRETFFILFSYACVCILAANYFILIKEFDMEGGPKKLSDIFLSFCAPWNFPIFLNLTHKQTLKYASKNHDEFLRSQLSGLVLLMKIFPLALIFKFIHFSMVKGLDYSFQLSDFTTFDFEDFIFFKVRDSIVTSYTGFRDVFAILFGGVCYIIGIIHLISSAVAIARNFGFNIPYEGVNAKSFRSFRKFIQNIYKYYSKTILEVYVVRLRFFMPKIDLIAKNRKEILVFSCLIIGGIVTNFLMEVVYSLYSKPIGTILFRALITIPYFIVFSFFILQNEKDTKSEYKFLKLFWSALKIITLLAFIYSLRRLVIFNMSWGEYFNIYYRFFEDLVDLVF